MKKVIYLAIIATGLSLMSCEKQELTPSTPSTITVVDTVFVHDTVVEVRVDSVLVSFEDQLTGTEYSVDLDGIILTAQKANGVVFISYSECVAQVTYVLETGYTFTVTEVNYIFDGEEIYNLVHTPINYIEIDGDKIYLSEKEKYELYLAFRYLHYL